MRRAVPVLAFLAACTALSCIELTVDGSELGSIDFVELPSPSIVVGDTLRDGTGAAWALRTRVYLADGSETTDLPVTYVLLDTFAQLEGDYLIARGNLNPDSLPKVQRVTASVGSLQSLTRGVSIVLRPDTVFATGVLEDTIEYNVPSTAADTSVGLSVRVVSGSGASQKGVKDWVVTYRLLRPDSTEVPAADTSRTFWLVETGGGRATAVDTTDTGGNAQRRLRFRLRAGQAAIDTMLVQVVARLRTNPLAGSPITYRILVRPKGTS